MTIMTWKYDFTDEGGPRIIAEYPGNEEVAAIIALVEETLTPITREG